MMAMAEDRLIDRLPPVRGRLSADWPLAPVTWFRVGGPAEVLFKPADHDDLAAFLAGCPADVPITVIGVASNLLVRDGGVPGVVIRLGRDFAGIRIAPELGESVVDAGSAALDVNVARVAAEGGVAGLEFLVGIPGTIGGALRMNAGAYGTELNEVLDHATAVDRRGQWHRATADDLGLRYRHSDAPKDWVFTGAVLKGAPGDSARILARMAEIADARGATQPIRSRTGGSTFANPPGEKAWQLIDRVGGRGLRVGGAQVSEQHCNFLINTGDATAADIEALGEELRRRVREAFGIELRWEIRRIGIPAGGEGPGHG